MTPGRNPFPLGIRGLIFRRKPLALGVDGLLLRRQAGLLGASAAIGRLVAVCRGCVTTPPSPPTVLAEWKYREYKTLRPARGGKGGCLALGKIEASFGDTPAANARSAVAATPWTGEAGSRPLGKESGRGRVLRLSS